MFNFKTLACSALLLGPGLATATESATELRFTCAMKGTTRAITAKIWEGLDRTREASILLSGAPFAVTATTLYSDGDFRHGQAKREVEVAVVPTDGGGAAFAHLNSMTPDRLVDSGIRIGPSGKVYEGGGTLLILPKTDAIEGRGALYFTKEGRPSSRRKLPLRCFFHRTHVYPTKESVPFG